MGLHPDGRRLVALCADSSLYQASLSARGVESFGDKDEGEGGAIERGVLVEGGSLQMAVAAPHVGACCCLAMAECGSLLATAGEGGDGRDDVGVWEFVGNEIRLSFRLGLPMGEARGAAGGLGPVECLTWCGDSALAVGTSSGSVFYCVGPLVCVLGPLFSFRTVRFLCSHNPSDDGVSVLLHLSLPYNLACDLHSSCLPACLSDCPPAAKLDG
jgi:hypothetical protein